MNDDEWISITDAAKRLTAAGDIIDRSSLSRYLSQHSEVLNLRREGRANLVDYAALSAHRSENVRIRATVRPTPIEQGAAQSRRFTGSQSEGAARKANADAEMREMDLAERRGELTLVAEVDKAGRDAIALMRSAFERSVDGEAASASVKYGWDERIVRLVLKSFSRRGVDAFHTELLKRLDEVMRNEMAAEQGDSLFVEAPLQ